MMRYVIRGFAMFLVLSHVDMVAQHMDNATLYQILDSVSDSLEGRPGMWHLQYNDRPMMVITDEYHDRMRIISPVEVMEEVSSAQVEAAMVANFHSTLDVRYAISDGILWAAFIHPFQALSEHQVRDALKQVYRAAETFGTSYSSSELVFPGGRSKGEGAGTEKKKM
jgi:hypothetical protein